MGMNRPATPGKPIQAPQNKPPTQRSGKAASKQGKVKKSAEEIVQLALDSIVALKKRDFASLTELMAEIRLLDTAERDALQKATAVLAKSEKDPVQALDGHSGCILPPSPSKGITGLP
jgi:hypothetical protein